MANTSYAQDSRASSTGSLVPNQPAVEGVRAKPKLKLELKPEEVKEVKVYRLEGTLGVEAKLLGDGDEAAASHLPGPGSLRSDGSPQDGITPYHPVDL